MSDWQWGAINSRNQLPGNRRNQLAFFYCPPLHSQPPYLIYTFAGYNRNLQFGPKKDIWYVKCWIEAKPAPMWIKLNMVFSDVMSWHCCHSMVRDWFSLVGLLEFELLWAPPLSSCVMIIWFGQFCRFGLVWFGLLSFVGLIEAGLSITVWHEESPPLSLSLWWGSCDKIARLPIYLPRAPISTLPPDTLLLPEIQYFGAQSFFTFAPVWHCCQLNRMLSNIAFIQDTLPLDQFGSL